MRVRPETASLLTTLSISHLLSLSFFFRDSLSSIFEMSVALFQEILNMISDPRQKREEIESALKATMKER